MRIERTGGCLCGSVQFSVDRDPEWVTICFCRFCQKATGSAYMIEPIFITEAFRLTSGKTETYTHVSEGSGKDIHVHFCSKCGTKINLTFERWADRLGVYASAFDDPNWFELSPENTKFIFSDEAQRGTVIPPGYRVFNQHAATPDGVPLEPVILPEPLLVRR